jgi:hypothetical protein
MNFGLLEIALLLGSAATAVAGALAAVSRRRSATLLALNVIFAVSFAYVAMKGLRFGSILAVVLGLVALANAAVASAIVSRAARNASRV